MFQLMYAVYSKHNKLEHLLDFLNLNSVQLKGYNESGWKINHILEKSSKLFGWTNQIMRTCVKFKNLNKNLKAEPYLD